MRVFTALAAFAYIVWFCIDLGSWWPLIAMVVILVVLAIAAISDDIADGGSR